MNAVIQHKEPELPAPVARRAIPEAQWRTLANNLFPGARSESVLMVWDYCVARKLDPMKKPCHIVPMKVGDSWRDVVMPGIYEYRTTANRTGEYLGHSKPVYGPEIEYLGVKAPEYCELTVYRWNSKAQQRCEFPVQVKFSECVATAWDKEAKGPKVNARWTKAPQQMLTKCTEAAGLREAFPDELGGEPTAEEMEGQLHQTDSTVITQERGDPRGDLSNVDWELRDEHVSHITDLLNGDEETMHQKIYDHVQRDLMRFPELFIAVNDKLAKDGIIPKAKFRKLYEVPPVPTDLDKIP
jgi:phage recombination protein Bet